MGDVALDVLGMNQVGHDALDLVLVDVCFLHQPQRGVQRCYLDLIVGWLVVEWSEK